jgi:hypothetical protein
MVPNQQLFNHVSEDTAFVITRFPAHYGQYTTIRYWVETKPAYGQRLMTRVMNHTNGEWFKAKTDGYKDIIILEQIIDESKTNCGLVVVYQLTLDTMSLEHLLQLASYYEFTPFQKQQIVRALAAKNYHRMPAWKPSNSLDYQLNKLAETRPEKWQKAVRLADPNGFPVESAHDAHLREKKDQRQSWESTKVAQSSKEVLPGLTQAEYDAMSPEQIATYKDVMGIE